jgi:aspartyl/asparaginyl-tRNA synthetase
VFESNDYSVSISASPGGEQALFCQCEIENNLGTHSVVRYCRVFKYGFPTHGLFGLTVKRLLIMDF